MEGQVRKSDIGGRMVYHAPAGTWKGSAQDLVIDNDVQFLV
jgi:hypothetical protein